MPVVHVERPPSPPAPRVGRAAATTTVTTSGSSFCLSIRAGVTHGSGRTGRRMRRGRLVVALYGAGGIVGAGAPADLRGDLEDNSPLAAEQSTQPANRVSHAEQGVGFRQRRVVLDS